VPPSAPGTMKELQEKGESTEIICALNRRAGVKEDKLFNKKMSLKGLVLMLEYYISNQCLNNESQWRFSLTN
jgi:hypothetical protein